MFKIINKMENHNNIEFYLLSLEIFITTRLEKQKMSIYISQIQTNSGKKSIQYAGAILWNKIPNSTNSLSFTSFKKEYKILIEY